MLWQAKSEIRVLVQKLAWQTLNRLISVELCVFSKYIIALEGLSNPTVYANSFFFRCGIISFISIAFIAVTFAIHLPTSILLDDVCYSIYNGLHGNQSPESFSNSINATDSGLRSILNNCFNTGSYFPGFENTFSFTSELLAALNDTSTQVLSYSFDPALTSDSNSLDDIITQTVAHIQGILIEINNRAANVSLESTSRSEILLNARQTKIARKTH
jgi:hypothetical protein